MGWNFRNSYSSLPAHFFERSVPTPVQKPELALFNEVLSEFLGLGFLSTLSDLPNWFSGNALPPGADPLAQAYAGHQYGHFTMLGDGRAILLGEQVTPSGKKFDVHLKGSGVTAYSRRGDGRAALGPMIREFIISEAMHALGIPTTRSLAVVTTGETVEREARLPGGILTRIAESHLRVGTFQFAAVSQKGAGLQALLNFAMNRHFPELLNHEFPALAFLEQVMERQASLIAQWMGVGFIHGVMNTDNMSICGETIDYGPCAFMDEYHPDTAFSSIDRHGRYAYQNQPAIAQWNLARLAEALLPLLSEDRSQAVSIAETILHRFMSRYEQNWLGIFRKKLGLITSEENDASLIQGLLSCMDDHALDLTNTFVGLTKQQIAPEWLEIEAFRSWHEAWTARLKRQPASAVEVQALMQTSNPLIIPRNHRVEEALKAATEGGDFSKAKDLIQVLQRPFVETPETEIFQIPPKPEEQVYQTFCGT